MIITCATLFLKYVAPLLDFTFVPLVDHGPRPDLTKDQRQETVAICPQCDFAWSNEQLLQSYLTNNGIVSGLTSLPDHQTRRLKYDELLR